MYEGSWLQSVALSFLAEMAGSEAAKFFVHERSKVFERLLVTVGPLGQQMGDLVSGGNPVHSKPQTPLCRRLYTAEILRETTFRASATRKTVCR